MLPAIAALLSAEMMRNGGSLLTIFQGTNGAKYALHFDLLSARGPNNEFIRLGYAKPVVFERFRFHEPGRDEWQAINPVEISWTHATVLLHQLRGFLCSEHDARWLAAMEETAVSKGKLPAGIDAIL
ncbi:MAG TPA: hypothetical protein VLA61_17120 [Ideonella sp.]|uniref:hypothetical protein n=1 Tax=Ideonella sp. TaxID=1929293 RepID=UPI002CC8E1CB|nr:hypothetical protein [Ideonella sp.]HSI49995.1 hypothetical protein [Ideonella sp.]